MSISEHNPPISEGSGMKSRDEALCCCDRVEFIEAQLLICVGGRLDTYVGMGVVPGQC